MLPAHTPSHWEGPGEQSHPAGTRALCLLLHDTSMLAESIRQGADTPAVSLLIHCSAPKTPCTWNHTDSDRGPREQMNKEVTGKMFKKQRDGPDRWAPGTQRRGSHYSGQACHSQARRQGGGIPAGPHTHRARRSRRGLAGQSPGGAMLARSPRLQRWVKGFMHAT